jgi:leucyl aminopeptidase
MSLQAAARSIVWSFDPLPVIDTDLLVIPWFETESASVFGGLDGATAGHIRRALESGEFAARPFDLFVTPVVDPGWRAGRIALIGAGRESAFSSFLARRLATAAGLAGRSRRAGRLAFVGRAGVADPSGDVDVAGLVQSIAEGLTLSEFNGATYQRGGDQHGPVPSFAVVIPRLQGSSPETPARIERAVRRGRVLGESSNLARALANEPGNALTPREFATRAAQLATEGGVSAEVLNEQQIEELGMGLLLGVARGSSEPPRVMVFRHDPPGAPPGPILGLVGKGITFDTGGISIKPADGMEKMKDDMAGGAAVACAMRALGLLEAPVRVVGVVPATENMPGGRAIKPGDVLRSAEGTTVEVINTDAEGRLILGDGLWYARRLGATHLVDVATLTGAIVVALGKHTSGLFGSPDWWVDHVRRVGERCGDRLWPMPLFDDYQEQLKSDIADIKNTGGRPGGSITAALFLKGFTGGLPWVHLDIAGTAWADDGQAYMPKGATGVAVRTLTELAFTSDGWR